MTKGSRKRGGDVISIHLLEVLQAVMPASHYWIRAVLLRKVLWQTAQQLQVALAAAVVVRCKMSSIDGRFV